MISIENTSDIFKKLLNEVNPITLIPSVLKYDENLRVLSIDDSDYQLKNGQQIYVIGTGKASSSMAAAVENILGDQLTGGLIISTPDPLHKPKIVNLEIGSHPYPDRKSEQASEKLIDLLETIPKGALVINLISGGTSSLFCKPVRGISIDDLNHTYKTLVTSGASIDEINTVRKSLSQVKGGKLLHKLSHVGLIDLIVSDVPDDNPADIGSGPTTRQSVNSSDAEAILKRYQLYYRMPESVRHVFESTQNNSEDNSADSPKFHHTHIISSASIVANRAREIWDELGVNTSIEETAWSGPIEEFTDHICTGLKELKTQTKPAVHIFFGECTLSVSGSGKGGRNQELALRMAKRLSNETSEVIFLSAGTDGIDGPTDAAGAVVDQSTWENAKRKNIDPQRFLTDNDSYHFFKKAGGHIHTGPTGNNVMDIQFLVIT